MFLTHEKNHRCKGSGEEKQNKTKYYVIFKKLPGNIPVLEPWLFLRVMFLGLWVFFSVFKFSVVNSKSF